MWPKRACLGPSTSAALHATGNLCRRKLSQSKSNTSAGAMQATRNLCRRKMPQSKSDSGGTANLPTGSVFCSWKMPIT
jgi:hypothetical protein